MSKLLYFRNRHDADRVMATLAGIAASHGYVNAGGPNSGAGSVAELLAAIASGEVAVVKLDDAQRNVVIPWLVTRAVTPSLTETLNAIAGALDEARLRKTATAKPL